MYTALWVSYKGVYTALWVSYRSVVGQFEMALHRLSPTPNWPTVRPDAALPRLELISTASRDAARKYAPIIYRN
jgi:hypothetical protein